MSTFKTNMTTTNTPNTIGDIDPLSLLCNVTTIYNLGDFPDVETYCRHCDSINYWCGRYDGKRAFQLVYLILVIVVGVFGNLLVIFSINYARRLYKHGNVFVVNLAIVDLMVSLIIFFNNIVLYKHGNVFVVNLAIVDLLVSFLLKCL